MAVAEEVLTDSEVLEIVFNSDKRFSDSTVTVLAVVIMKLTT